METFGSRASCGQTAKSQPLGHPLPNPHSLSCHTAETTTHECAHGTIVCFCAARFIRVQTEVRDRLLYTHTLEAGHRLAGCLTHTPHSRSCYYELLISHTLSHTHTHTAILSVSTYISQIYLNKTHSNSTESYKLDSLSEHTVTREDEGHFPY